MSTLKTTFIRSPDTPDSEFEEIWLYGDGTANAQLSSIGFDSIAGYRNKIINGDMRVDQRNNGAAVSGLSTTKYPVDRFSVLVQQGSGHTAQQVAPYIDSSKYLRVSIGTGASPVSSNIARITHGIEGFTVEDLRWGTGGADSVALSFMVFSSVAGTFSGGLYNPAANRSYIFTYNIPTANEYYYKEIRIPGDASGILNTGNNAGLYVNWDLGTGVTYQGTEGAWSSGHKWATPSSVKLAATSGATFNISEVQLEVGRFADAYASTFERRRYEQELVLCQRYYQTRDASNYSTAGIQTASGQAFQQNTIFPVRMRAAPIVTLPGGTATNCSVALTAYTDGLKLIATSSGGATTTAWSYSYSGTATFDAEF